MVSCSLICPDWRYSSDGFELEIYHDKCANALLKAFVLRVKIGFNKYSHLLCACVTVDTTCLQDNYIYI